MRQLLILVLTLLPLLASAQHQPKTWSLKEAIEYGLKNHGSVKIAENGKEMAHQRARQSLSGALPQINGSATLDDNLKRQVQVIPAGVFGPEAREVQFGTKYSGTLNGELTQTLYDQALLVGLKANKPNKELANLNAVQNQEELVFNITQAYYQILISETQQKLLQDNLDMYAKMHKVLALQVKKGVTPQVELDKMEVNLNNTRSQITATENTVQLAKNTLKYHMGMPQDTTPIAVSNQGLTSVTQVATTAPNFDYKSQTSFKIQQNQITLRELDAKRIQAGALPKLSAYGRYGTQAVNNSLGEITRSLNDYSAIGLRLSLPIFDGFSRNAQARQAKLEVANAQENLKLSEETAKVQYQNALTRLQQTQLTLQNNQRNVELAQKVLITTQLQYEKGVAGFADLLTSQQSLKDAQNTYISNLLNYYQSKLDVERANGTLLTFYQILP